MKSKKVTMLAAALVVAVVAAAGIGYATQYTATTSNDGNKLDSTYIVLTEDGDAGIPYSDILDKVQYNTTTTASGTTYVPNYTNTIDTDTWVISSTSNNTYAKISKDMTLSFNMAHTADQSVTLKATVDNFVAINGVTYTMVLTPTSTTGTSYGATLNTSTLEWNLGAMNLGTDDSYSFKVSIFISITGDAITPGTNQHIETAGFNDNGTASGSKITFTATAGTA